MLSIWFFSLRIHQFLTFLWRSSMTISGMVDGSKFFLDCDIIGSYHPCRAPFHQHQSVLLWSDFGEKGLVFKWSIREHSLRAWYPKWNVQIDMVDDVVLMDQDAPWVSWLQGNRDLPWQKWLRYKCNHEDQVLKAGVSSVKISDGHWVRCVVCSRC